MLQRLLLAVLLSSHIALLAWSAARHSATLNEPAHLVAGLSHWKFGRFDLYRVNPPLVRMVAAIPITIVDTTKIGPTLRRRRARDPYSKWGVILWTQTSETRSV